MFDQDEDGNDGLDRRSVLQTIAGTAASAGFGVSTARAAGENKLETKENQMRQRFQDEQEVVEVFTGTTLALIGELESDGKVPKSVVETVRGLVQRSHVRVVVDEVAGDGVTHVQLTPRGLEIKFVHQLELDRTLAVVPTRQGTRSYSSQNSDGTIRSDYCPVVEEYCADEEDCSESGYDGVRHEKHCCSDRFAPHCYWTTECCQQY